MKVLIPDSRVLAAIDVIRNQVGPLGKNEDKLILGLCDNENSPITIIQPSITIITIMPYILEVQQNYKYELRILQFRTK